MSNVDKLVQYAELKVGQFGVSYREDYENDKVHEIQPRDLIADGTNIIVKYDEHNFVLDLTKSGVRGEVTPDEAIEVVARMKDFYKYN